MNPRLKILVVEDEEAIALGLVDLLVYHGFDVELAACGRQGLELALSNIYDLLILDVMLPEIDGFAICEAVRRVSSEQPIIILTANDEERARVRGLRLGADDYIEKPFSVEELTLRVKAVLRRSRKALALQEALVVGAKIFIDTRNLIGRKDRLPTDSDNPTDLISFTRREVEILRYLKAHSDRPVPRGELLREVWGYHKSGSIDTRTVDIHIAKLRKKIETNGPTQTLLVTVRGEGYKLVESAR